MVRLEIKRNKTELEHSVLSLWIIPWYVLRLRLSLTSVEELQQSTLLQCNKWEAYDESTQKQYEPSLFTNPPISESLNSSSVVAAGGTFDHLHVGHKILLTMSAWLGNNVSIGISCDALLKNKQYKEMLESFDARTEGVAKFLKFVRKDTNPFLFPLYDVFGPTITEPNIDYLVVSRETEQGGVMIQAKRKVSKLKPLKVFTISLISIEISVQLGTAQQKLSSTEIRKELSMVC
ncbi:cytidylyltransferase [Schizosaccharomyces japonicus yFS275]|uniref:Cytidylyltransferase n=1 Tax=Schizosaccharomyces japonicus (strain yFS275 / FY16936) TaxID=402676 RepID=B6K169_SCHJY|nr:cytidylyltransferase [Schizosaccharomyces japonicus yFS275]EEB07690.1 cytidylyltransferase [Schizosaccharomyces japonicus yFS275]